MSVTIWAMQNTEWEACSVCGQPFVSCEGIHNSAGFWI